MRQPRATDRGSREEDGERADSEGWADEAAGPERDRRQSGVVRRAADAETSARQPLVPCATIHDVVDAYAGFVWRIVDRADVGSEAGAIRQDVFLNMQVLVQKRGMPDDVPAMLARITQRRIQDHWRVSWYSFQPV
jgi:hypothetical protein